ncbi:MAG: hypothetical protein ABFD63_03855 [Smithella sp.]
MKPVQACIDSSCRYFERPGAINTRRVLEIDENIISTGGSSSGIDTALVLQPANSSSFLDVKIREVICKPAYF